MNRVTHNMEAWSQQRHGEAAGGREKTQAEADGGFGEQLESMRIKSSQLSNDLNGQRKRYVKLKDQHAKLISEVENVISATRAQGRRFARSAER